MKGRGLGVKQSHAGRLSLAAISETVRLRLHLGRAFSLAQLQLVSLCCDAQRVTSCHGVVGCNPRIDAHHQAAQIAKSFPIGSYEIPREALGSNSGRL